MRDKSIVVLASLLIAGCDYAQTAATPAEKSVDGYAGLKFGMSFNEALSATQSGLFNSYGINKCMNELPIRGCLLHPDTNLASALSRDGVPYGLGLAFNKFDKLTDISLEFERETTEDTEQEMMRDDCAAIHERSIDWLAVEFGKFDNKEEKDGKPETTARGNPFVASKTNDKNTYFASAGTPLPGNRSIRVISFYARLSPDHTSCRISISFREPDTVARWTINPDLEKTLKNIIEQVDEE